MLIFGMAVALIRCKKSLFISNSKLSNLARKSNKKLGDFSMGATDQRLFFAQIQVVPHKSNSYAKFVFCIHLF